MRDDDDPPALPGRPSGALKWIVAALAVALLGGGGWLAFDAFSDEAHSPENALPPLPVPGEATVRPLVSAGGGVGWTWMNPRPRSMPTWYAVSAARGGDPVVMVGAEGEAVRYEDGALYRWATGTERALRGVAFTGAREALAAGEGGALIRLGPDGPSPIESGVTSTLRAVAAVSPTEALVVGDDGVAMRVTGTAVSRLEVDGAPDLMAAFARGPQVFVAGTGGTVLRVEGGVVTREVVPVSRTLRGIGGCPDGDVYAAGDQGTILRRTRDGVWHALRITGSAAQTAVSCDHGRVAIVDSEGRVLLVSGERTVALPSGFDRAWHALSGGTDGASWLVGAGGRLATIEADHVRARTAGPTAPIRGLGGMGGALVAVGEWGRILRERESGLTQGASPTQSGLAAAIQIDDGRLLAVGDFGALVDIRFDRASLLPSPTQSSLRSGVSEGDALLIVGASGVVLRGSLELLRASVVPDAGDLWDVAGTPTDALVVGDAGLVLRFDEQGFARVPCGGDGTLRSVVRTDEGAWAVGDGGRIVRIESAGCVEERRGGPDLHALGVGPGGRLIAGGDDGVVLERTGASSTGEASWTRVGVDVVGASVRAIWRNDRYVYLAGTGGVLVRHILVDGS